MKKSVKEPLVVAFIGRDDPHRGDSRGAVGVARAAAEMLGGRYKAVYDDDLTSHFNSKSAYTERLQEFAREFDAEGGVDILLGSTCHEIHGFLKKEPLIIESRWNEEYSEKRIAAPAGLVAHDLTKGKLQAEADLFKTHYPDIKGPLVGIMMGGCCVNIPSIVDDLLLKARHHDALTFFICPSRRTESYYDQIMDEIRNRRRDDFPELVVLGKEYDKAISGYNPYYGLLGSADHLVLIGESGSMISEALFTGKPLYMAHMFQVQMSPLKFQGYLTELDGDTDKPFISRQMPPLNVTADVAASIADEYLQKKDEIAKICKRSSGGAFMI